MLIDAELCSYLIADTGIFDELVDRIYPAMSRPQGDPLPAIAYQRVSTVRDYTHSGDSYYTVVRFQLDILSKTREQARRIANLVRSRLSGYAGAMGSITVQGVFIDDDTDTPYQEESGVIQAVRMDILVHFEEVE